MLNAGLLGTRGGGSTPLRRCVPWTFEHKGVSMSARKPIGEKKPTTVAANDPDDMKGALKSLGGSRSDHWNNLLANQAIQALWVKNSDADTRDRQISATITFGRTGTRGSPPWKRQRALPG